MSMKIFYMHACTFLLLCCGIMAEERTPRKRQIYREQVLPHAGGRIPDTAFETDRLFLNRLQKDGIAIPDGIVPEQRSPQVYQYYHKSPRAVYRIALSSDGRYTAKEGKYTQRSFEDVPSVETTYLYPQIHGQDVVLSPPSAVFPVYRQFQLHNSQLNQVKFQPKKKLSSPTAPISSNGGSSSSYQIIGGSSNHINHHNNQPSKTRSKGSHHTQSYQNFNLLNVPLNPVVRNTFKPSTRTGKNYYLPNYNTAHLFNDFDEIFNKFDIDESTALRY